LRDEFYVVLVVDGFGCGSTLVCDIFTDSIAQGWLYLGDKGVHGRFVQINVESID
jgi:hypothetical protein